MIQYDESMSIHDVEAYWAGGYILFPNEEDKGQLIFARVRARAGDLISLYPVDFHDDSPRVLDSTSVPVTKRTFFKRAVLHRPPVNIVEVDGEVYQLRWAPPDRGPSRAITVSSLYIKKLHGHKDRLEEPFNSLVSFQEAAFRRAKFPEQLKNSARTLVVPKKPLSSLFVLLHYLNNKDTKGISSLQKAQECLATVGTARALDDDAWILSATPRILKLYVGDTVISTVVRDGEFYAALEKDGMWEHVVSQYLTSWNFNKE